MPDRRLILLILLILSLLSLQTGLAQDKTGPPPKGPAKAAQAEQPPQAPAEEPPAKAPPAEDDSSQPITITSNTLEADDKAATVVFTGEVKAVQGASTLWCDKMVVHYEKEKMPPGSKKEPKREIKLIEVFGHVKVVKEDRTALGREGVYELKTRKVTLWGGAQLIQGQNTVEGEKVTFWLDEDRTVVESGPSQVKAVLISEPEDKAKP